jgi:catechol 2,3-dioxygenase-like lactoylglutathione lyase family enzyme
MQFTKLKEAHLLVKNLRKAISFYQDILGFRTQSYVKEKHAVFVAGSTMLVCHLAKSTNEDGQSLIQLSYPNQHIVLESKANEYETNKEEMAYHDIVILQETVRESGKRSFFIHDPDMNLIEITEYNAWES